MASKKSDKKISDEIIETSMDLTIDYSEIAIDKIFDDSVLEEIPVIKTILSTYKIGKSIKERHFAKKLMVFLQRFHSQEINKEKLDEFKKKFIGDIKYQNKVMEHIVIFNDRFIEIEKSKIFANLLVSHIENKTDWRFFLEITHCLERISPNSLRILHSLAKHDFKIPFGDKLDDSFTKGILMSAGILSTVTSDSYEYKGSLGHDLYLLGKMNNIL